MNIFLNSIEKILFLDKVLYQSFFLDNVGILELNNEFFFDIPKVGSSSIKHFISLSSNRYKVIHRYSKWRPVHTISLSTKRDRIINSNKPIRLIVRDPLSRLYSVYQQKVLNKKEFPFGYFLESNIVNYAGIGKRVSSSSSFKEFCSYIGEFILQDDFLNKPFPLSKFDKHITPITYLVKQIIDDYCLPMDFRLNISSIEYLDDILLKKNNENFSRINITNSKDKIEKESIEDNEFHSLTKGIYNLDKKLFDHISGLNDSGLIITCANFLEDFQSDIY